jgi:hypothetical protein
MCPLHVSISFELTGVGLIAVAIWALRFTRRQISAMQESNRKQADSARNQELQLRANVLLTLDQRWESEPMILLRAELQVLVTDVLREAASKWPTRSIADLRRLNAPAFAARLRDLGEKNPAKQLRLFQICGFFETVGYVARRNYLTLIDVYELFSVSINATAIVFRPYIDDLLNNEGADPLLFYNLRWLIAQVEKQQAISLAP